MAAWASTGSGRPVDVQGLGSSASPGLNGSGLFCSRLSENGVRISWGSVRETRRFMRRSSHLKQRDSWQYFVIYVAIAGLVITLAGRFPSLSAPQTVSVQSAALSAKIQHRDKDALSWAAPVPRFLLLWSPLPILTITWRNDLVPVSYIECALYDRPPPLC